MIHSCSLAQVSWELADPGWVSSLNLPPSYRLCPSLFHICHPLGSEDYLVYVHMVMAEVQEDRTDCCVTHANIPLGKTIHGTKLKVKGREG